MSDGSTTSVAAAADLPPRDRRRLYAGALLGLVAFILFYASTNGRMKHMDYTFRVAGAFLHGQLGLTERPPSWLNEAVPHGGRFHSVFPFGAVVSMTPVAVLKELKIVDEFPARALAALLAACSVYFFFRLAECEPVSVPKRALFALYPVFGTCTWCNLGFAGAWQMALGFALLGQAAALYFTLVTPRPLLAGAFFALAWGNRTEIVLTAPIYLYFWFGKPRLWDAQVFRTLIDRLNANARPILCFLAVPFFLGLCTMGYNLARVGSIFDFGYSRIPGVLDEPWYKNGIFSLRAIPWNAFKMLFEGFQDISKFPFLRPHGFGASIFLASPFLFLLFREGGRFRIVSWSVIGALTLFLWCHGNPGGWQFSYRYAIPLLPWAFLILLGNGPRKLTVTEIALLALSFAISGMATYQFLWTDQIKP